VTALVAPPAPSWDVLLTDWSLDIAFPAVVAAGAAYVFGLRRLHARGRPWPVARTIPFLSGLAVIMIATQSGLAAYDRVLFSLHVVQHVLLGMVAPLLLVLGAPVTLALQAGSRRTQQKILRVLHSAPARVLTHPLTAWVLFGGSLVVLYFTPLYELSLRNDWVHAAVHVHFVVAGSLFLAHVVGLDPIPGALRYGARLLYVMVLLPFHAFVGIALLTTNTAIAADWYEHVERTWGASPLSDQRTGAGLLWISGELFGVLAIGLVVWQWMAAEERAAARHDRRLDTPDGADAGPEPIGARGDR
jgi:putative membrane protein